jgi:BirA family biotin operon repressor/biotin-[acetyl-CoA-carboxylase] ligase
MPATHLTGLSLVAGFAVIQAVETLLPELQGQLQLKWPNDVIVSNRAGNPRKLAGILCEATASHPDQPVRVVVGIGLNCSADFADPNLASTAVSLHQLVPQVPTELELLTSLRTWLLALTTDANPANSLAALLSQYPSRDTLAGCMLSFAPSEDAPLVTGMGAGISPQGQLLIRETNGQVTAFTTGRVLSWKPQWRP